MSKPSMVKACEVADDTYNGVQFLCCQPPQLSTPKPWKGGKPSNLLRSAVVSKHSNGMYTYIGYDRLKFERKLFTYSIF